MLPRRGYGRGGGGTGTFLRAGRYFRCAERALILQDARNKAAGEPAGRAASDRERYCMDNEMSFWISSCVGMIKRLPLTSRPNLKAAELQ